MKFVISSNDLVNQLQSLVRVIKSKNTLPALDYFLFELKDKELKITASDLETTLISVIEIENAEGSGVVGLEARKLLETVREFNEPLTFNIDTDTFDVDLTSSKGQFRLVAIDGEEYPEVPEVQNDNPVKLNAEAMITAINATLFAAAVEELRPVMTGVYFKFTDDSMVVAATDSNKLVKYKRTDVSHAEETIFILPAKPATILKSLLPKDETLVEISINQKVAKIQYSSITLICKLIEGNFPNFESVIPTELPYKVTLDRVAFQSVIRRVSLYTSQSAQAIKLDLTPVEMNVSAQDLDFSIEGKESLNCIWDGEEVSIGFKADVLLEVITNFPFSEINIGMSEPTRPVLITPVEKRNEKEDILMLLMPINV